MEYDTYNIIRCLYCYTVALHSHRTEIKHFHQHISNFQAYRTYCLFQLFSDFLRFVKLFALQMHRARAPTATYETVYCINAIFFNIKKCYL
jgi:hypothetical protein